MSKRIHIRIKSLKKNHGALKTLVHIGPKKAKVIIDNSPNSFINLFRVLAKLILDGTIQLKKHHVTKLKRHKKLIRSVAVSKGANTKKLLHQNGGSFFKNVLKTVLPLIPLLAF